MVDRGWPAPAFRGSALLIVLLGWLPGCSVVPGTRLDESQRLVQSLRVENARLKDRVLGLETQNRDLADRAVDDLRRLTARDQALDRLERSVQAYQEDRDRLSAAYRRMATSLGRPLADGSSLPTAGFRDGSTTARPAERKDLEDGRGSERLSSTGDEDS